MANGAMMTEPVAVAPQPVKNFGWPVTFAGMGINLALGVLYSWSVISKEIPAEWGWTEAARSMPYSVACLVFSLIMVPAGRMQDRIGPRIVATIGGLLVGLGMILAGFTTSTLGYILGFGLLAGAGIGFGYASATRPAASVFPPPAPASSRVWWLPVSDWPASMPRRWPSPSSKPMGFQPP